MRHVGGMRRKSWTFSLPRYYWDNAIHWIEIGFPSYILDYGRERTTTLFFQHKRNEDCVARASFLSGIFYMISYVIGESWIDVMFSFSLENRRKKGTVFYLSLTCSIRVKTKVSTSVAILPPGISAKGDWDFGQEGDFSHKRYNFISIFFSLPLPGLVFLFYSMPTICLVAPLFRRLYTQELHGNVTRTLKPFLFFRPCCLSLNSFSPIWTLISSFSWRPRDVFVSI